MGHDSEKKFDSTSLKAISFTQLKNNVNNLLVTRHKKNLLFPHVKQSEKSLQH